ncbi:uncharacterized protein LOC134209491 isoform X1 [Armigeres subalbatus]|uniref:uncharacterized protein LOC134209491 isoform X1 n=1 Tax=Armigeres subalbatus TaxID=124917 RepID=UPI002ED103AC
MIVIAADRRSTSVARLQTPYTADRARRRLPYASHTFVTLRLFVLPKSNSRATRLRLVCQYEDPSKLCSKTFADCCHDYQCCWIPRERYECEYCLKILPEWTEATQMMMDRKFSDLVQFAHVDCISEEEFCSRLDITDYPTIRTYMRGPPRRFELVYPYLLEDTVEYMKDYLLNSTDNSDDSDDT